MAQGQLALQLELEKLNVAAYFQPPPSLTMQYPCIVYERDGEDVVHADNLRFRSYDRYQLTVIDRDPDSAISAAVKLLPYCSFSRSFTADNLNHDVFTLFF